MAKAWYVNPAKRRKTKKRRTAKQKAAFRKMRAGLRAYLAKKKGKKSKKRRKKAHKTSAPKRRRKSKSIARARAAKKAARTRAAKKAARSRAAKKAARSRKRKGTHMAKKAHRRAKHRRRKGRSRRTVSFRRVKGSNFWRRNPGGFLGRALGLIKEGGPGAVGAAVLDLYGIEPLMARFSIPRAVQPAVKVAAGLAVCAAVDKWAPKYRKHAEAAAIGLMAIAAKKAIGRLIGHPTSKVEDVADYYNGLNELVEVPHMGELVSGGALDAVQQQAFAGWPEVYA